MFDKKTYWEIIEKAAKNYRNAAKSARRVKYDKICEKYEKAIAKKDPVVNGDSAMVIMWIGGKLSESGFCPIWHIDEKARAEHNEAIHALRHSLPHCAVYADAASVKISVDGKDFQIFGIGNIPGDGDYNVWILPECDDAELTFDDGSEFFTRDRLLAKFSGKNLSIYKFDCGDEIAEEKTFDTRKDFYLYAVRNGWKIIIGE